MKIVKRLALILLLFIALSVLSHKTYSIECTQDAINSNSGNADVLNQIKEQCQKSLTNLQQQATSLSSEIQLFDTKIYLTTLQIQDTENKIQKTQEEINTLGGRIVNLNTSLDNLTKILLQKIVAAYKRRNTPVFEIFLDSNTASTLMNQLTYIKRTERNDQRVAFQLQQAKINYEQQKKLREQKKIELDQLTQTLESQKIDLKSQQAAKQRLLVETQNSEAVFQNLLAKAQAEYAAIQGIFSGAGTETRLRDVSKGDTIASIIPGPSCNSSGAHVHFTVEIGGSTVNPFSYLKPVSYTDNSDGDPWTPSGSWDWPVNPPIQFNQGYGVTSFVRTYNWYPFHNGIDVSGTSYDVRAVADGTLYRGSYTGNGGCILPYAKVVHKDGGISTFYLHTIAQ